MLILKEPAVFRTLSNICDEAFGRYFCKKLQQMFGRVLSMSLLIPKNASVVRYQYAKVKWILVHERWNLPQTYPKKCSVIVRKQTF